MQRFHSDACADAWNVCVIAEFVQTAITLSSKNGKTLLPMLNGVFGWKVTWICWIYFTYASVTIDHKKLQKAEALFKNK